MFTAESLSLAFATGAIALPWLGALLIWLANGLRLADDERPRAFQGLAILFSLAAALSALLLIPYAAPDAVVSLYAGAFFGAFTLVADGMAIFLTAIATVIGSLAVIFSVDYMRGEPQQARYYALVLLFIGAMSGLVLSGSLLLMFLFWEITAFCSYALISFYNDDPRAVAAGIKALIMTQLGGIGLLLGALAVYGYLGDYQIATLLSGASELPANVLAFIAFSFLLAAMAKSAQAPFHTWLPDAMEAPTPVSALIHAATMVNAGIYLLARFYPAFAAVPGWTGAVVGVGVVTALLAAMMALTSVDLKRVLAYSTVSQLGYMTYAVGVGGIFAAQFHLLSHAVFKALLFLAAGAIIHSVGTRDMRQMGGLARRLPLVGVIFALGAAALAGIPPLNGFWSKELVLENGLHDGPVVAYALMLLGVGLTAAYTLRMVWMVFLAPAAEPQAHVHREGAAMRTALIPLGLGALLTWLAAGPFATWLHDSLPFHSLHALSTGELLAEIGGAPSTYVTLLVAALGLGLWWWRGRQGPVSALQPLARIAQQGFGFEYINGRLIAAVQSTATATQQTQTGQLSWNVAGILLGLAAVLIYLLIGG